MIKIFFYSTILLLFSCAGNRGYILDKHKRDIGSSKSVQTDDLELLAKHALASWDNRHNKRELRKSLSLFEKLVLRIGEDKFANGLDQKGICLYLARGYYLLGDAHITRNNKQKKKYWKEGTKWAEQGMVLNKKFRTKLEKYGDIITALPQLEEKDVEVTYWYLANLGKWVKNSGVDNASKYRDLIFAMASKVQELNDQVFYGGIFRYFGAFYALSPNYAGGDTSLSKINFEKSLKMYPNYLGTKVLYAELYAKKAGKQHLYKKLLEEVIGHKLDKSSELYPENFLEQKKAQTLYRKL